MEFGSIRWAIEMWLLPPGGPLLLALVALVLLMRSQFRSAVGLQRAAMLVALIGVVATLLLTLPVVTGLMAQALESQVKAPSEAALRGAASGPAAAGAVVILGGGARRGALESMPGYHPNRRTWERLAHGAWVARLTGLPVLVTGGAGSADAEAEGLVMARALEGAFGLPVRWRETRSANTAQNARESAAMLRSEGITHIVLVTHAYHMPRSAAVFRVAGLRVTQAPHSYLASPGLSLGDFVPSAGSLESAWLVLHELLGQAWYRLTGRMPGPAAS